MKTLVAPQKPQEKGVCDENNFKNDSLEFASRSCWVSVDSATRKTL